MLGDNGIHIKESIKMDKLLVVVDMQNDFIDGVLGSPEAQAIVPKVVKRIKESINNNEIIFFTKDTHYSNNKDYLNSEEGKHLPIPHCINGTYGHKLNSEIADYFNSYDYACSVFKNTFGYDWGLEQSVLKDILKDINEIEIIGLDTDFCVLANAMTLKTAFPNAHIVINAECCAGSTPEWHEKALDMLEHCHCEIINRK